MKKQKKFKTTLRGLYNIKITGDFIINNLKQIKMKVRSAVIKFKLMENKPCIEGTYPIYLIIQFNGRAVYSTGERCSVEVWNGGKCRDVPVSYTHLTLPTICSV